MMIVTELKKKLHKVSVLLAGVMMFGALGAIDALNTQPETATAEAETIFRFEIEVPEEYLAGGEKQYSDFLFAINLNKNEWREVTDLTTSCKLEYEVYSPTAVPGVGFFSVQDQTKWKFLTNHFEYEYAHEAVAKEGGMTDSNGVSVFSGADLSDYIADGWYQRSITLSELPSTKICHAVIGVHKATNVIWEKEKLIDGNKIVVYYKNIYFDVNGHKVSPIASGITPEAGISIENFSSKQQNNGLDYSTTGYLGWQGMSPFTAESTNENKILSPKFSLSAGVVDFSNPLLATKAQVNAEGTAIRFVSSVDSLDYKEVGFEITIGDKTKTVTSSTVYTSILAGGNTVLPTVFGEEAAYLFTYTIWNIPADQKDTVITLKAFWVDMDGTVTYGAENSFTVSGVQALSA